MKKLARLAAFILLMLPAVVNAQNVVITGTVKNASGGESLGSVSVTLKGSSVGTFTDPKGISPQSSFLHQISRNVIVLFYWIWHF